MVMRWLARIGDQVVGEVQKFCWLLDLRFEYSVLIDSEFELLHSLPDPQGLPLPLLTLTGTLIEVLCQLLFPGDGVPPLLIDLISNLENYSNVMVATLAVLEFEKYSVPHYGYKTFGLLSKISWCLEQPPPEFLFRGEICAVHTNKDPVTQQFQKNWSLGWCLNLMMFFILLFVDHSMILSPSLSKSSFSFRPLWKLTEQLHHALTTRWLSTTATQLCLCKVIITVSVVEPFFQFINLLSLCCQIL